MSSELVNKLIQAGIDKSEAVKEVSILKKEFSDPSKILELIEERTKTRKPLQYLLGKAFFMDFEVKVTPEVLIPRPETEILVEEAIKRLQTISTDCRDMPWHALDIGTGSGIIPIALCRMMPNIEVIAIDINQSIIDLAYNNAKSNRVQERIKFKVCDLFAKDFEEIFKKNDFNLIISNPPYVIDDNLNKLAPEVSFHEPRISLVGSKPNQTGLIYYERILSLVSVNRKPGFKQLIALEIDSPLVNELKLLLKNMGLNNYEFLKDYSGHQRCLFGYI